MEAAMSAYPTSSPDRRANLDMRLLVDKAKAIGARAGFIDAADFMYQAQIPQEVALRVLITICKAPH